MSLLLQYISVNLSDSCSLKVSPDLLFPLQAVHMLVTASADLQKDIVEGGRVSHKKEKLQQSFKPSPATL